MKKISISIFLILICYLGYGQFPIQQNLGSTTTLVNVPANGGLRAGLINRVFTDTTSANLSNLDFYDGAQIKTLSPINAIWWRDSTNSIWVQVLPSGGSGGQRAWLDGGNFSVFADGAGNAVFGTLANNGVYFKTNATTRLLLNKGGIQPETSNTVVLGVDTVTKDITYATGGGGGSSWLLAGNGSTTPGTNFIGTTDSVDFVVKTKALERLRVNANGALGVGTGTDYGTAGYSLITQGSSTAPTWSYPTVPINNLLAATGTNTIDNGSNVQAWGWNTLGEIGGNTQGLYLYSNSTTTESGSDLLISQVVGANVNPNIETRAATFDNHHTGTNSTNIAINAQAYDGTNNFAINVALGKVRIQSLSAYNNVGDSMVVWNKADSTLGYRTIPSGSGGISGLTTNELVYGNSATTIASLPVATYPSLTELSYVKGVTSGLQTQINAKAPIASPTFTGTVTIPTPFTLGATSVTTTGAQLNYLNAATGTTGTTSSNVVYSASPTLSGTTNAAAITASGLITANGYIRIPDDAYPNKLIQFGSASGSAYITLESATKGFAFVNSSGGKSGFFTSAASDILTCNDNGLTGFSNSSPASTVDINGSFAMKYAATATSITLGISNCVVNVTATGQTITLPTAVGITGRIYTIKLTASGTGTVATTSSQTIDSSTTYSLASQYKYVTVQSTGANWIVIANN